MLDGPKVIPITACYNIIVSVVAYTLLTHISSTFLAHVHEIPKFPLSCDEYVHA